MGHLVPTCALTSESTVSDTPARSESSSEENGEVCVLGIMGDLHLEPGQMPLFHEGQQQMSNTLDRLTNAVASSRPCRDSSCSVSFVDPAMMSIQGPSSPILSPSSEDASESEGKRPCKTLVVQLGDVGGYMNAPGSLRCFEEAVKFLDAFGFPRRSVTGNHDLEGAEFETDEENLAAWQQMFGQHHYWVEDAGGAVCIGLSTVQFRSAEDSCHEVYIDDVQFQWLQQQLEAYSDRPVFVFSHAAPMGCGLTSLQEVHVRNRCAWLNHSNNPQKFLSLVRQHPNIQLWFSGHFHLSHDYEGSVSRVGQCLFVQTGVMGGCHRDGRRHSRVVAADKWGYRLMTLDHGTGELRTDVVHQYSLESQGLPPQRLWCSTLSFLRDCPGGGVFAPQMPSDLARRDKDQMPPGTIEMMQKGVQWLQHGSMLLAVHANQIVQYDMGTRAPVGVVTDGLNGREVKLVLGRVEGSAEEEVVAVELHPTEETKRYARGERTVKGSLDLEVISRNSKGGFWKIFQVNKWQLKRAKERAHSASLAGTAVPA